MTGFLAGAQSRGAVRDDVPAADLAAVLLSSLAGLVLTRRQSSPRGLRAARRRGVELLEPVLLGPSEGARRAMARPRR